MTRPFEELKIIEIGLYTLRAELDIVEWSRITKYPRFRLSLPFFHSFAVVVICECSKIICCVHFSHESRHNHTYSRSKVYRPFDWIHYFIIKVFFFYQNEG